MKQEIYIIGVGNNTPVFIELAQDCGYKVKGLYHYNDQRTGEMVCGIRIIGCTADLNDEDLTGRNFALSMGDNKIRVEIAEMLEKQGAQFPVLVHPTAFVSRFAKLEAGVCIQPHTTVMANVYIEKFTTVSYNCTVMHDAHIAQGCYIAANAAVGAYIKMKPQAFVGLNATIISGKVECIGANSLIGAGAVVTRSVESNRVVAGNPARTIKKIMEGNIAVEKEIDLVYVLGKGSAWNDNELRFSLRSVEKNLMGVRKVYVVGERPEFLTDKVIHIPHPDPLQQNADGNMAMKILRACEEKGLSDDFLFMNDDFIINQPMVAAEIPWLHKGDFCGRTEKFWKAQFYRFRLRRTFDVLAERGLQTIQYDYHAPMLMNKYKFPEVMAQFNFKEDIGYTFRSLYGNVLKLPAISVDGEKITIYHKYTLEQIKRKTKNIPFVGYNDNGLNNSLKWWLAENFGTPSKYEKGPVEDKIVEIFNWQNNGENYDAGVGIFERHYKHHNLLRLLKMGETRALRKKMEYKLTQTINQL